MFKISITEKAFSKAERQKVIDDFFSIIDSKYVDACGYLTLSFEKATGSPLRKLEQDSHKEC